MTAIDQRFMARTEATRASYEYASTVWGAEEENAKRLATRKTLVAGFPGAVLAFSGFKATQLGPLAKAMEMGGLTAWLTGLSLGFGVFCLIASICRSLGVRRTGVKLSPMASLVLHPADDAELEVFTEALEQDVRVDAAVRLFEAARILREANEGQRTALQRALEWLVTGITLLLVGFLAYVWV